MGCVPLRPAKIAAPVKRIAVLAVAMVFVPRAMMKIAVIVRKIVVVSPPMLALPLCVFPMEAIFSGD